MLAASNRLRDRRAIATTMRRGRLVATGPLMLRTAPNHLGLSRIVVVVSKKVSKKAVVRNRIRRRLAAELATTWETVTPGYDIVVTVRDDIADLPTAQLSSRVGALIERGGLRATP